MESKDISNNELMIGGIKVKFPCKPYPSQLSMMSKIIKGLQNGHHCLLESPTGSGKTLALLCSALAWQEDMQRKIDSENARCNDDGGCQRSGTGSTDDFENEKSSCEGCDGGMVLKKKVPKIWFGTRTHKQIAQITHELARTAYKNVNMTILSSREHSCIHPINEKSKNKNDGCRELMRGKHADALGAHCSYYQNVHRMKTHTSLYGCGITSAWDLEDLVNLGRRVRACPYYSSRELITSASIIFCPYNYLVDPGIRSHMSINLNGQILIFDEAHNIEDCARDAASNTLNDSDLVNTIADLDHLIADEVKVEEHKPLHLLCTKIGQWLQARSEVLTETGYETWSRVWFGKEFLSCLAEWGITIDTLPVLQKCFMEAVANEQEGEEEFPKMLHTASQGLLGGLFHVLSYLLYGDQKYVGDFRIAVIRQAEYGVPPPKRSREGWISMNKRSTRYFSTNLHFWCLNPAVAFSNMTSAHCIVLTSGTLSPMVSFSSELGVSFPIQLEAAHVIADSQVWVGSIGAGPNGQQLQATYQNTNAYNFQDELGKLIHAVCKVVPYGVLCFFSSYKMLEKLCERWENTGLWSELSRVKVIFSEPHGRNKSNFQEVMQSFYNFTSASEEGTETNGALLLAVCRGKISEGIDFSDNNARAVITVGIPFPNFKDQQVELKRKYNDEHCKNRGLLSGSDWYEIQAFRALNQALGRCIRHKNDWGALVIVDDRFCKNPKRYCKGLSKWVRLKVKTYQTFQLANSSLASFCHARQSGYSPEKSSEMNNSSLSTSRFCSIDSFKCHNSSAETSFSSMQPTSTAFQSEQGFKSPCKATDSTFLLQNRNVPGAAVSPKKVLAAENSARITEDVVMIPLTPKKEDRVIVIPESPENFDYRNDTSQPTSSKRKSLVSLSPKATISNRLSKKCRQAIKFDADSIKSPTAIFAKSEDSQELFAPKTRRRRRSLKANRRDEPKPSNQRTLDDFKATKPKQNFSCNSCKIELFTNIDLVSASNVFHYIRNKFDGNSTLYVVPFSQDRSSLSKIISSDTAISLDAVWCATDQLAYQFYACNSCHSLLAFSVVNSDKYPNFFLLPSKTSPSGDSF